MGIGKYLERIHFFSCYLGAFLFFNYVNINLCLPGFILVQRLDWNQS